MRFFLTHNFRLISVSRNSLLLNGMWAKAPSILSIPLTFRETMTRVTLNVEQFSYTSHLQFSKFNALPSHVCETTLNTAQITMYRTRLSSNIPCLQCSRSHSSPSYLCIEVNWAQSNWPCSIRLEFHCLYCILSPSNMCKLALKTPRCRKMPPVWWRHPTVIHRIRNCFDIALIAKLHLVCTFITYL